LITTWCRRARRKALDPQFDAAIVEQQPGPGSSAAKISGCGSAMRVPSPGWSAVEVEPEGGAGLQHDLALGEGADPQLRPLQVEQDADRAAQRAFERTQDVEALLVVVVGAVAEVQAEHVGAGTEHGFQRGAVVLAGPTVATIFALR
jgi:hypothetical protein